MAPISPVLKSSRLRVFTLVLVLAFDFVLPMTLVSRADAAESAWVGGLFGLAVPNATDTTARAMYGITGGAKVGSDFGFGVYYLTSPKDESVGGVSSKFDFDLYGIEGAVHFEGEAKGVYLGGRLGTSKVTTGASGGTLSTSPFHFGLLAGYNHMLGDRLSLGGEANFFSVAKSEGTPSGAVLTRTIDSFTILSFLATIKVWF